MTTHTLNPTGPAASSAYTYVGATTAAAALVDVLDSSYVQIAAGVGIDFTLADLTLPAGAVVKSYALTFRTNRSSGSAVSAPFRLTATELGTSAALVLTPTTTITDYSAATVNETISQESLNALRFTAFNNGEAADGVLRIYRAFATIVVAERPTVDVLAPTGTVTTTSTPVVSWTYTPGSDGGPQDRAQVRIFTAAQWAAVGFDPLTSAAAYDSGEIAGAGLAHTPTEPLANATTFYAFVRVAQLVNGAPQWSAWNWCRFALESDAAEVLSVVATPSSSTASISVLVTRNTAYKAWQYVRVERSVDSGVTWSPVRGGATIDAADEYVAAFSGDTATIVDYEVPNGSTAIYRARAYRTALAVPPPPGSGTAPTGTTVTQAFTTGTTAADVGFTNQASTMVVSSGKFRASATSTQAHAYNATDLGSVDHYVEADVEFGSGTAWQNDWPGLTVRDNGSTTYYGIEHLGDPGRTSEFRLSKWITGTRSNLAFGDFPSGFTASTTYRFRLEINGSTLRFYVDDVLAIEHTDTSITTGTKAGLLHYTDSLGQTVFDNFEAGSAAGSSGGSGETGVNVRASANFNAANGTTTTALGFALVDVLGGGPDGNLVNMRTDGNKIEPTATSSDMIAYHTTDLGSSDHWAEVDLVIAGQMTNGGHYAGVNVRTRAGVPFTWWKMEVYGSHNQVRLLAVVNEIVTVERYAPWTFQIGKTYRLRLEAEGSSIRGYVDGSLVFDIVSTAIMDGTKAGVNMYGTVADRVYLDNFEAGNFLTGSSATPSGYFNNGTGLNVGKIVGPDGGVFTALGVNVVAGANPDANSDAAWTSLKVAQTRGAAADTLNMTAVRFIVPDPLIQHRWDYPPVTTDVSRADMIAGVIECIDEYIALGIVCLWKIFPERGPGSNPTVAELEGSFALALFDAIVAEYKSDPLRQLVWLCPLSEGFTVVEDDGTGPGAQWGPVGTWFYDRARAAGWDGMFVWELPNYGQAIQWANTSTALGEWLDGKYRVVSGWNYWGVPTDIADVLAIDDAIKAQGRAIVNLEGGQHRNHSGTPLTTGSWWFTKHETNWASYVLNAAGGLVQGFGAMWWTGGFRTTDESVCMTTTGSAFWEAGTRSYAWNLVHAELTSPTLVPTRNGGPYTTAIPSGATSGSGTGGGGAGNLIAGAWAQSAGAVWSSVSTWLKDVFNPSRNVAVRVTSQSSAKRPRRQGRFSVLGRRTPVVVSDVLAAPELDLTLVTLTDAEAVDVLEVLDAAPVVLVQTPSAERLGSVYLAVGNVVEERPAPTVEAQPARYWQLSAVEVDRPEDETT